MIKINYVLIPKEIIYNNSLTKNRVILYTYLALKRGLDDTVGLSCDSVVKWCGYKPNYNKGKINDQMVQLLEIMISNKYIKLLSSNDKKLSEIISKNYFFEIGINQIKFDIPSQFGLIYFDEIMNIKNFKSNINNSEKCTKISPAILLLLLSYLRMNMLRRQDKYVGKPSNKPEFCYRMYIDIENDINLSSRYISKAVDILKELDLIETLTMPRWKDDKNNWHTEVTLFVNKYKRKDGGDSLDTSFNYQQELQWGVEYIKEKKFLKKKFNQDTEKQ